MFSSQKRRSASSFEGRAVCEAAVASAADAMLRDQSSSDAVQAKWKRGIISIKCEWRAENVSFAFESSSACVALRCPRLAYLFESRKISFVWGNIGALPCHKVQVIRRYVVTQDSSDGQPKSLVFFVRYRYCPEISDAASTLYVSVTSIDH